MDPHNLSLLLRAYALNAQVESMKAANTAKTIRGKPGPYTADDFGRVADELHGLASNVWTG